MNEKMNKQGLIEKMQNVIEGETITKKEAEKQLQRVIAALKDGLKEDGKVQLVGELTAEIKDTKASSGVMNGVEWTKPAGKTVKIKVAKNFIEEVVGA